MNVNWKDSVATARNLTFDDLNLNESFRNVNGRGAVYVKVQVHNSDDEYMMELATGKLFNPTVSPVERVNVDVNVNASKPRFY
jgi:hypothetical protein